MATARWCTSVIVSAWATRALRSHRPGHAKTGPCVRGCLLGGEPAKCRRLFGVGLALSATTPRITVQLPSTLTGPPAHLAARVTPLVQPHGQTHTGCGAAACPACVWHLCGARPHCFSRMRAPRSTAPVNVAQHWQPCVQPTGTTPTVVAVCNPLCARAARVSATPRAQHHRSGPRVRTRRAQHRMAQCAPHRCNRVRRWQRTPSQLATALR